MERKALVLDGRLNDRLIADRLDDSIREWLVQKGWQVTTRTLRDVSIAPCIGCFGCWIKTPGVCVIDDEGRDVAAQIVRSDLVVYVTPVQFGGYSYELKKAIDRSIPMISPYFRILNGEVHHKTRYNAYPSVAAFAWSETSQNAKERETFETLVKRNAINMMAPRTSVGFIDPDDLEAIDELVAHNLGMVVAS